MPGDGWDAVLRIFEKRVIQNKYFIFIKDIYGRDREVLKGLNEEFTIWQTRAIN